MRLLPTRKTIPSVLALTGVILCQIHGGPFWGFLLDNIILGWALSILWEGMSVWLWWENKRPFLKWLPTVFLLFGMIFQSAIPFMSEVEHAQNVQNAQENARNVLERVLQVVVDQERRGFKDTLDNLIGKALIEPSAPKDAPLWVMTYLLPIVPLFAYPTVYYLCLVFIAGVRKEPLPIEDVPAVPAVPEIAERCRVAIQTRLDSGESYAVISEATDISKSVLNGIVNRERLQREGGTVIGVKTIQKHAPALGVK